MMQQSRRQSRTRKLVASSLAALLAVASAGCWDVPLSGSTVPSRSSPIQFHAFVPVPHGSPLPTERVRIHLEGGALVQDFQLTPDMFEQTLGLYDWYEISFTTNFRASEWKRSHGRYYVKLSSSFWVPWLVDSYMGLPFFTNGADVLCFRNKIADDFTIQAARTACNAVTSATVYADAP